MTSLKVHRGVAALAAGTGLIAVLAGCSQVEGLATQANMNVIYLATAATDALLAQGVDIAQVPRCTVDAAKLYTCTGVTADGAAILVEVPENDADPEMTISVGGLEVFRGPVLTTLDDAAQAR